MFDLVVPVYNSPHHVTSCLFSIIENSTLPYRLYIVSDGSDEYTSRKLEEFSNNNPNIEYVPLDQNQGYLYAANKGGTLGNNPYIVFVNSDTVVTAGYLERVRDVFQNNTNVGICSAVSNWANWTRICWKIPEGHNIHSIANTVQGECSENVLDINNASGFFFATTRELFEKLDGFDKIYGKGYWEEADYCMRVLQLGSRVVVDDGLYIYHHGWGSFKKSGRNENMEKNKQIFMGRWKSEYSRIEAEWRRKNPISYMERAVLEKQKNHPEIFSQPALKTTPTRTPLTIKQISRELQALEKTEDTRELYSDIANRKSFEPDRNKPFRVIYVLPAVKIYGGIISVLQIVNQLILRGVDANIATWGEVEEETYGLFPTFFSAYRYSSKEELVSKLPECDLIVATSWDSVYPVTLLLKLRPNLSAAYFVQDYEPDFYLDTHPEKEKLAEKTYSMIPHKIVKTRWLANRLKNFDGHIHRIPLGLNLDYFHDHHEPRANQILALGRPQSLRRNFQTVVDVYTALHKRYPDLRLALYGFGYNVSELPFPCTDYGRLTNMQDVADALNASTILLDCSLFQGFGRPGLEAMACGTVPVLTHEGGITQYAKHNYNCMLIDPIDQNSILSTISSILDTPDAYKTHIMNAKKTSEEYSLVAEGRRTLQLLKSIASNRLKHDSDYEYWDNLKQ